MTSDCRDFQDRLIAHGGDKSAFEPDLERHVSACAACASLAQRVAGQVAAFTDLGRRTAPMELDGRVVAACHGGHRQERAIAQLQALTRWHAPAELDARVLRVLNIEFGRVSNESRKAPAVLERLVDEELHDQPKAIAQRFAGRLERLRAPGVLRVRVERTAEGPLSLGRRRMRILAAASLVVVLLLSIGGGIYWLEKPRYSFMVVHESSLDELYPMAGSILGGVTGGMTDAQHSAGVKR